MENFQQLIAQRFSFLTQEDFEWLISVSSIKMIEANEILIREGELSFQGYFVLEGMLRNYHINHHGDEKTVLFTWEGQTIVAYSSTFLNEPATEFTEALEPTTVLNLDFRDLRRKAEENPRVNKAYIQMLEEALIACIHRVDDFTQNSPEERYLALLKKQPLLLQRVPQKHLASYLGITHISLSRIRARVAKKW